MTRTWTVRLALVGILLALCSYALWAGKTSPPPDTPLSPSVVLAQLKAGNGRFVTCSRTVSTDTQHDAERRRQLALSQHPIAAVLCCADSRICPEFIFDQHLGSIFELRNVGNVVDEDVMASLEYAVEHLHVPLILVMGHKGCGAIAAVHAAGDKPLPNHLKDLQAHMTGLRAEILGERQDGSPAFLNHLAEQNNRQQAVLLVRQSEVVGEAVRTGRVLLVVGMYDMESGKVDFQDAMPFLTK
jgi:carbonic anhydrase